MKLYEISAAMEDVIENSFHVVEGTGEVFEAEDLDKLDMLFEQKLEATALYVKNLDAEAEAVKAEKMVFAERQSALEKRSKRLKEYMAHAMAKAGKKKVETPLCLLRTRKTERVEVLDKESVPDFLMRIPTPKPEPDLNAIKARIKAGEIIPGCALVSGESLTIK